MAARRKHGKRSCVAAIAKARARVVRAMNKTIEREANMALAHALLALQHAKKHVLAAERVTCRTL